MKTLEQTQIEIVKLEVLDIIATSGIKGDTEEGVNNGGDF